MPKSTPEEHLRDARRISREHNMFVLSRGNALLLYRRTGSERSAFLGRTADAKALHSLVKRCAKTAQ